MKYLAAALGFAALGACASLEPEPCSADWIQWKTEQTLKPFAAEHRGLISDLRGFSKNLDNPGPVTMLRMASKLDDFRDLASDFQDGVMPELRLAADQCGSPAKFVPAFTTFLRDEGVEEDMLAWVETLGALAVEQSES